LLLVLTFVTGLVDALSYLNLGRVFVANMTGNVVFLGFAVAGAQGFSIVASVVAIAAFLVGALAGGKLGAIAGAHRGRHLALATMLLGAAMGALLALEVGSSAVLVLALEIANGIAASRLSSSAAAWTAPR
jgi:uncharacterized membrane protein YoaK (UPF0700 family)